MKISKRIGILCPRHSFEREKEDFFSSLTRSRIKITAEKQLFLETKIETQKRPKNEAFYDMSLFLRDSKQEKYEKRLLHFIFPQKHNLVVK
ncbi:MAG TPA: hypothetical protein VMR73_02195 [Candidatus Paceibacterota bacterium]|nr:hypothetical protein [Candidatus Paceibacterota bacterium]